MNEARNTMTPDLAVVVGGASGIGAAVVATYRAGGDPVLVWDRAGQHDVTCDISDPDQIERATEKTLGEVGVPTKLTITAGIGHGGFLLDVTPEDWDRVMSVNTRGVWLTMRSIARAMIDAGVAGSIVVTSSVSGRLSDPMMGPYCASKAALNMTVRVAAAEWAAHRIRVNAVAPGVTETPMLGGAPTGEGWLAHVARRTAMGRLGRAEDIAAAIHALHRLEWVTGQVLECDGGLSLYSPIDLFGETLDPPEPGFA